MKFIEFIKELLGPKNAKKFCTWAFGSGYKKIKTIRTFAFLWNQLHRDLYVIKLGSTIAYDVPIMIKLWRLEKQDCK